MEIGVCLSLIKAKYTINLMLIRTRKLNGKEIDGESTLNVEI